MKCVSVRQLGLEAEVLFIEHYNTISHDISRGSGGIPKSRELYMSTFEFFQSL